MSTAVIRRQTTQLPANLLAGCRAILGRLVPSGRSTSLLPFIPKPIKLLLLLLVLVNSPSFPFVWHIRVWWYAVKAYWLVYRKGRKRYLDDWVRRNRWDGGIAKVRTRTKRIAWLDDCDYNNHLSNSCYSKNTDPARMNYCIVALSPLFTPGSHMALGASHYVFFKEIPTGSEYVMECRTGGWGDKWFYIVIDFIIYPKAGKSTSTSKAGTKSSHSSIADKATKLENKLLSAVAAEGGGAGSVIPTISAPPSGYGSPTGNDSGASGSSTPATLGEVKRKADRRAREPRKDGGVVCCTSVFEYCFKMGRVTVPPRIALYLALQSPSAEERDHARKLVLSKDHGRAFLRGGWQDLPNADQLGRNIGLVDNDSEDEQWFEKGRKAMEGVNEGLAVF